VVLTTIVLYYQLYVGGAVAPQILQHYGMSFRFYVNITVVASVFGAFSSILAGIADKWGRANLVVYGLLVTSLLVLFAIPNAGSSWTFGVIVTAIGFVEGIILVATPALVRDFSPQLGRASAMGFWTLGPVVGSLVVSVVATNTLSHLRPWQDQFVICGIASLVVFALSFVFLRELSPPLRDQLMVSIRDRALIEAKAKGIDVDKALRHPWRQMLHFDVIASAFAISVFLLIYFTAVGFNVVYFESVFGFSATQANSLGNWFWGLDAAVLVGVGLLSDRIRVRKPFMILGGICAVVMTVLWAEAAVRPHTSYDTFVIMSVLLAASLAVAYSPWMASFTETVERRNPALVATGLAVWGWIIRAVVAISVFCIPFVVTSTTTLVDHAPITAQAQAILRSDPNVQVVLEHPALFAELQKYPPNAIPPALLATAIHQIGLPTLLAIGADPNIKQNVAFFRTNAAALAEAQAAQKSAGAEWRRWFYVCVAGELVFLPLVLVMAGRWSPASAKRDEHEHEAEVTKEMAELGISA
jgi:MFS family permease